MVFEITPDIAPILEDINKMSDADAEKVAKGLASIRPHLKLNKLIDQAAENGISSELVTGLFRMTTSRVNAEASVEQFAEDVTRAMTAAYSGKIDPAKFQRRLATLLAVDSLTISARAYDIQHEYPNIFDSARILTDIRPLFTVAGSDLIGEMVVHNLKILYYNGSGYQEIYVSMDDSDLMLLNKVIERAEQKSSVLEATLKRSDVRYFESK